MEKFGQNNEGLSSADVEATGLDSLTEQQAAMRRSEFEKEAILRVVRTERIPMPDPPAFSRGQT